MKKYYLLLISLFLLTSINSQSKFGNITLTYGEEIEEDKEKIVRIAGEENDKIYTLATKGDHYFIKVFSANEMKLLNTEKIELPKLKDKSLEFENFKLINNKLYVFGSLYDRKNKLANLVAAQVSEDGKLTGEKIEIFSTKVTKKSEKGAFYFKRTPSRDKLLIMHASLFDKEEVIQYEIKLVDENLNIITSHIEKVPFEDRSDLEFTIADFDVSANEDIFLVINESYRDKKQKKNIEKFEVHAFKKAANYTKEVIKIDAEGNEIINCELLATNNGLLQLVGYYSSVNKRGKANWDLKGVYASTINLSSNEVLKIKFNEFDLETKIKLIGERRAKKGKDVKPYYVPHSLIEKEDGGLILLAEYKLVYVGRSNGIGPLAFSPVQFTTNEIIVTSLNPDGTVKWSNVVPKEQKAAFTTLSFGIFAFSGNSNFTVGAGFSIPLAVLGKGPEYLSAIPIYQNNKLTVVFNDNIKNIGVTDIEKIKPLGNYNKAIPAAFTFDENGAVTRKDPENIDEDRLIIRPGVFYRKTPKDYIIYASKRSKDKLGRLTIN